MIISLRQVEDNRKGQTAFWNTTLIIINSLCLSLSLCDCVCVCVPERIIHVYLHLYVHICVAYVYICVRVCLRVRCSLCVCQLVIFFWCVQAAGTDHCWWIVNIWPPSNPNPSGDINRLFSGPGCLSLASDLGHPHGPYHQPPLEDTVASRARPLVPSKDIIRCRVCVPKCTESKDMIRRLLAVR